MKDFCKFGLSFAISLVLVLLLRSPVQADSSVIEEEGESTFELIPDEAKVRATITYHIRNVDPKTVTRRSYYYYYAIPLPSKARNITVSGEASLLPGQPVALNTYFNRQEVSLTNQLFYHDTARFTVKYDLVGASKSTFRFFAYGHVGASQVTIMVPRQHKSEVFLSEPGYLKRQTATHDLYSYSVPGGSGRGFVTEVSAVIRPESTEAKVLSDIIFSNNKRIPIDIQYWQDEEHEARYILDLYGRAIPILEEIIGVPFPPSYPLIVKKATLQEMKGFDGRNSGKGGIAIEASRINTSAVLIHELAHFWAASPPFGEAWMREGFADLYTYLALERLGYPSDAREHRKDLFAEYEHFRLLRRPYSPLSEVTIPSELNNRNRREASYSYARSFVFVFSIYTAIDLPALQKFNQRLFASNKKIDWLDFVYGLEAVNGRNLSNSYAGWILPGVPDASSGSFPGWERAKNAYHAAELEVPMPTGVPGPAAGMSSVGTKLAAEPVRKALMTARELLVAGRYDRAINQSGEAARLARKWLEAENAYSEAEKAVSAIKGKAGAQVVEQSLRLAYLSLTSGRYDEVPVQSQSAVGILDRWTVAEGMYSQAGEAVSAIKGKAGSQVVERSLGQALEFLVNGRYDEVSRQSRTTLEVLSKWQAAHTAYVQAEQAVSSAKAGRGMEKVREALGQARDLLAEGTYDQVPEKARHTRELLEKWKEAESAFGQAESAIAPFRGQPGMVEVQKSLDKALGLLTEGRYDESATQSGLTGQLLSKWQGAHTAYLQAEQATEKAEQEGRTSGLDDVKAGLASARASLTSGQFDDASTLSDQTLKNAGQLKTPSSALLPWVAGALFGLFVLIVLWFSRKRAKGWRGSTS